MTAQPARIDLADLGPGVAWAFEFDENGRGRLLEGNSSFDLTHGRRFVWVHLILGNVGARDWIGAQDVLPPEAREVFLSKDRHPSLHWGGEALWGTLHDVRHEDQTAGMEATDLRFALWPQFLLTARHHAARSAIAVRDQAEKGATFEDSAALFESLLVAAADSIGETTQEIAGQLDQIEDRVLSDSLRDESAALLRLRRGISRQERLVQAAHSVLSQLNKTARRASFRRIVTWAPGCGSGSMLSTPTSVYRLSARGCCRRNWRRSSRPRPIATSSRSRSSRPCSCLRPS
jgi:Mg2+ and Co2+ transporter CorA